MGDPMTDRIDEPGLVGLMAESSDLQSDAMKLARRDLDGYVEAAQEARLESGRERSYAKPLAVAAAGGFGLAALALAPSAFAASPSNDIRALQTAAGIENLAITAYKTALTLPFIGGASANGVVKAFAQMTMKQHTDHAQAFNAAVVKLGGKQQTGTDPKYTPVLAQAVPTIKTALDVVNLAITLEDVAAQTYVADVGLVSTSQLRQLFGSVAGVEAQHKAILLAVQALLKGNAPQLIALPPNAASCRSGRQRRFPRRVLPNQPGRPDHRRSRLMRRKPSQPEMAISEAELSSMTRQLDELHQETFPGVRKSLDDFSANLSHLAAQHPTGRRSFLVGLGGLAVVGGVAACSSSSKSPAPATSSAAAGSAPMSASGSASAASKYTGDLKVVALAAALENLAVEAYMGALTMAAQNKLGAVPPAVATFITTAKAQHADHAQAWNGVLSKANLPAITGTPLTIASTEVAKLQAARSVPDVAKVALALENAAAQTYLFAATNVTDSGGIMTAATIEPVEAMHAAILSFVLGQYPVPMSFIGVDQAVMPTAFTG